MVVTTGEVVAQEFEKMVYPLGSTVKYSAYSVGHMIDGELEEQFVMKTGTLAGYDDTFGGIPHIIIEPCPEEKMKSQMPKCIPIDCLRRGVELVLVDPAAEKIAPAADMGDKVHGLERHFTRRMMAYLGGNGLRTV
jgi:hypothetical protein